MTTKLIQNWQKKNHQLSQLMLDSIEGLDVWGTVVALGEIRRGVLIVFYLELLKLILTIVVLVLNFFAIKKLMKEYRYFSNKIKNWKNR
ncbi:TPA: hypothetical protein TXY87_001355 [Streptococcus suis]|nr:hypothetical protein [Streptococcus suis]HEL1792240.1 hypothetical protein [Streptococcus suis]HEL1826581.1 hypothetical protein [Streptococcus suis]HEL1842058.1 hypothetical protein [Streptococcus suis]HEL2529139.1 hypothetical protein [Streptococcus suis]